MFLLATRPVSLLQETWKFLFHTICFLKCNQDGFLDSQICDTIAEIVSYTAKAKSLEK